MEELKIKIKNFVSENKSELINSGMIIAGAYLVGYTVGKKSNSLTIRTTGYVLENGDVVGRYSSVTTR